MLFWLGMPNSRVKMCLCRHAIPADGFRDLHLGTIHRDKVELFKPEPGIDGVSRCLALLVEPRAVGLLCIRCLFPLFRSSEC